MISGSLVSVVIPAYNAEQYVGEAIKSVLEQTYNDYEIIVVNDGSADRTADVVKGFKDERINLINHSSNRGVGAARNTAIEAARGRWIALLDADDKWLPVRLDRLVGIALTLGHQYFISDDGLICFNTSKGLKPWDSCFNLYYKIPFNNKVLSMGLDGYFNYSCPAINPLIPLQHVKEHDLRYDPACLMGEDFEFNCNLFRTGLQLCLYNEPLRGYRLTPGSLTTNINKFEHQAGVYKRLLEREGFTRRERDLIKAGFKKLKEKQPYERFSTALKQKDYRRAAYLLVQRPRLLINLLRRFPQIVRYRKAVRKYGGDMR